MVEVDGQVEGWCHLSRPDASDQPEWGSLDQNDGEAILSAICFTQIGLAHCDELLVAAEKRAAEKGCHSISAGPLRDQQCGFVGLAPTGHGIGIPDVDVRASSLLSRHGFSPRRSFHRMVATTAPYRPPVSREMMQLRRTTRTERQHVLPIAGRHASAMSHLDIEHHQLVNHRTGELMANVRLWMSDPEAQVMSCAETILDLSPIETPERLTLGETFLIAALIQTMATRCVFRVETGINAEYTELQSQLEALQFESTGRGQRWIKEI